MVFDVAHPSTPLLAPAAAAATQVVITPDGLYAIRVPRDPGAARCPTASQGVTSRRAARRGGGGAGCEGPSRQRDVAGPAGAGGGRGSEAARSRPSRRPARGSSIEPIKDNHAHTHTQRLTPAARRATRLCSSACCCRCQSHRSAALLILGSAGRGGAWRCVSIRAPTARRGETLH